MQHRPVSTASPNATTMRRAPCAVRGVPGLFYHLTEMVCRTPRSWSSDEDCAKNGCMPPCMRGCPQQYVALTAVSTAPCAHRRCCLAPQPIPACSSSMPHARHHPLLLLTHPSVSLPLPLPLYRPLFLNKHTHTHAHTHARARLTRYKESYPDLSVEMCTEACTDECTQQCDQTCKNQKWLSHPIHADVSEAHAKKKDYGESGKGVCGEG